MRGNRLIAVVLAGIMAAGVLSGCTGSGSTTPTTAAESKKETEAVKTEATGGEATDQKAGESSGQASDSEDEMGYNDLVATAKDEGTLIFYGANSYLQDAADRFTREFGVKVEFIQLGEMEMIKKITSKCQSSAVSTDLVYAQDIYRIMAELIDTGYAISWSNSRVGGLVGNDDCTALIWYYDTKNFMYNDKLVGEKWLTNLWRVTDPEYKGLFTIEDLSSEGVNFDTLTMFASDGYAARLAGTYEEYFGKDITSTVDNAGWESIKMMFQNGVLLTTSDTTSATTMEALGQTDTWVGYFSTQRFSTQEDKGIKLSYDLSACNPVGGYAYPACSVILNNCQHPSTAKLFSEWLLSESGWAAFGDYYGGLSASPANVHVTDYGFDKIKKNIVLDNPDYLINHHADVEDLIKTLR